MNPIVILNTKTLLRSASFCRCITEIVSCEKWVVELLRAFLFIINRSKTQSFLRTMYCVFLAEDSVRHVWSVFNSSRKRRFPLIHVSSYRLTLLAPLTIFVRTSAFLCMLLLHEYGKSS